MSKLIDTPASELHPNDSTVRPLRVGMVGTGNYGAFRRHCMRETGLFRIVSAYDHNPVALEECVRQDGAVAASSYLEMLEQHDLEAVVISTGAKDHAWQAIDAMRRGLHVFVEKPLCATRNEVDELIREHRESGVVFVAGHHDHTTDPVALETSEIIQSGTLGKIATFHKVSAHSGGLKIQPGDWRGDASRNPGGMLFQCGVHGLHELMFHFGAVAEVASAMCYGVHTTATADVAACVLTMESGIVGTLCAYHVTPYLHRLEVLGTEGYLSVDERFGEEGVVRFVQSRSPLGQYEGREQLRPVREERDQLELLRRFYRAIRYGEDPYPGLLEGCRAVAVVFAAQLSADSGQSISMSEMFPEIFQVQPLPTRPLVS